MQSCIHLMVATLVILSGGDLANAARPQPGQLASHVQRESNLHPGRSAILPLPEGQEALAARVALIRAAEHTLEVQYYIWNNDAAGLLLLSELTHAADRGVKVRLIVDDFPNRGMDPLLSAVNHHPGIEVRLFNPFHHRRARFLDFLTRFRQVNRRMHNKSMTADRAITIVGGRNVGDHYFGGDDEHPFSDLDVLAAGPVAAEVGEAFDSYWTCASSVPVEKVVSSTVKSQQLAIAQTEIAHAADHSRAKAYLDKVRRFPSLSQPFQSQLRWEWCRVEFVGDDPAKALGSPKSKALHLVHHLDQSMKPPRKNVELISPYFVPRKQGTYQLAALEKRGVQVRVLTNSLASNNVLSVHSGYAPSRKALLMAGVTLFEVRPDAGARSALVSLHAKTFSVDDARWFVGSFNMDPRSAHTNTEMGLLIDSPKLAKATSAAFAREIPQLAYEVRLDAQGNLEWVERDASGHTIHRKEPSTTVGRRLLSRFLSLLPIKDLL